MEHEVFVPVPAEPLREALNDPAAVARAVPGLQQDAGEIPGVGRLKIRVGGTTITYRGALRIAPSGPDRFSVEGEGVEVRGPGGIKVALSVRLAPGDDGEGTTGTVLTFSGGASADGRAGELAPEAVRSAVERLLTRFAEALAEDTGGGSGSGGVPTMDPAPVEQLPTPVAEVDVPPSSLDPFAVFDDENDEIDADDEVDEDAAIMGDGAPPAEAAHARRTMIGRSAEEVDHAPPRGRYAPVPAPEATLPNATLRWAAPAAALAIASAIVVGRALRRRR
ncbi:SRPBCC family protein [Streptomyces sp. NPDC091292]|uniref:SRPBCC family protein n=1 Tax=Streptomyces sp. NPDC091292 TaxID=3365991 RepID=UPI0037F752B7